MKVIRANDEPGIAVWLNGRNVSLACTACWVPRKQGRTGFGWVDLIPGKEEGGCLAAEMEDDAGNLITHRKWGLVKWLPAPTFAGLRRFWELESPRYAAAARTLDKHIESWKEEGVRQ